MCRSGGMSRTSPPSPPGWTRRRPGSGSRCAPPTGASPWGATWPPARRWRRRWTPSITPASTWESTGWRTAALPGRPTAGGRRPQARRAPMRASRQTSPSPWCWSAGWPGPWTTPSRTTSGPCSWTTARGGPTLTSMSPAAPTSCLWRDCVSWPSCGQGDIRRARRALSSPGRRGSSSTCTSWPWPPPVWAVWPWPSRAGTT